MTAVSQAVQEGAGCGEQQKFEPSQPECEMAASGEARVALAPIEQSGLGACPGDPGAWLFLISPPGGEGAFGSVLSPPVPAVRSAEHDAAVLVERWVRRLALGGDGRRAAARLEIGAGRFAGAELVVVAEPGRISVEINLPAAGLDAGLSDRLRGRLEALGYGADVTVR